MHVWNNIKVKSNAFKFSSILTRKHMVGDEGTGKNMQPVTLPSLYNQYHII